VNVVLFDVGNNDDVIDIDMVDIGITATLLRTTRPLLT